MAIILVPAAIALAITAAGLLYIVHELPRYRAAEFIADHNAPEWTFYGLDQQLPWWHLFVGSRIADHLDERVNAVSIQDTSIDQSDVRLLDSTFSIRGLDLVNVELSHETLLEVAAIDGLDNLIIVGFPVTADELLVMIENPSLRTIAINGHSPELNEDVIERARQRRPDITLMIPNRE